MMDFAARGVKRGKVCFAEFGGTQAKIGEGPLLVYYVLKSVGLFIEC
jgi:hypothetical protein